MPFADLYTYETFAQIADAAWWRTNDFEADRRAGKFDQKGYEAAHKADMADKARLEEHKTIFSAAVEKHLENLRTGGRLKPTAGLKGRKVSIPSAWNAFVAGEKGDHTRAWLFSSFRSVLIKHLVRIDERRRTRKEKPDHVPGTHVAPTAKQIRKAWKQICLTMDEGNSECSMLGWGIECIDGKTGDRCELVFTNWAAQLMVYDENYDLVPAKDAKIIKLVTAEFDVPTGRLMLTDQLRIESFVKGTDFDEDRDYEELDLNSGVGRTARISAHAKDHGFGFTQTTNTSVAVYHNDAGLLMVTERFMGDRWPMDPEQRPVIEGWTCVGDFSCDVWRVTAIDRATVLARMADGGDAASETELDRYLSMADAEVDRSDHQAHHEKCYAGNIVHLDVEPGRWSIHAGEDFSKRVSRKKFGIPKGVKPWCILTRVA